MTYYDRWRDVPKAAWRWPNFSPAEIACRGTGRLLLNDVALDKLCTAPGPLDSRLHYAAHGRFWSSHL